MWENFSDYSFKFIQEQCNLGSTTPKSNYSSQENPLESGSGTKIIHEDLSKFVTE